MRRVALLTIPLLLLPYPAAGTQQPTQNTLPNPADFVAAGPNCKRKVNLSPWVGTPGVEWPKTFRCVLTIITCDGVKTYTSGVRAAGTGMCADYWKAHDALVNREICCDPGSPEEKQPPSDKPTPETKCEPPTPWFDRSLNCQEPADPQLTISGSTATLYMCGYAVFSFSNTALQDQLTAEAYRAAIKSELQYSGISKVCCDRFQDAVKTGKPCDPRADMDCDGQPNQTDSAQNNQMPDIDTFTRPNHASIDDFPRRKL
jgi:hypothetical protein